MHLISMLDHIAAAERTAHNNAEHFESGIRAQLTARS
jgi:hypothetical protein